MPAMNASEMTMPSGFSITFSTSAYAKIRVTSAKPMAARGWPRRRAEMVTAKAADTIIARMPVA
jgi:hypothetical protein